MTARYITYAERGLDELRRAAEEHTEAGLGRTLDADALHEAIRTAEDMRDRIIAEPVLDGNTRMMPAGSLIPGDELVAPGGTSGGVVTAVTRYRHWVAIQVDVPREHGSMLNYDRRNPVEVWSRPHSAQHQRNDDREE